MPISWLFLRYNLGTGSIFAYRGGGEGGASGVWRGGSYYRRWSPQILDLHKNQAPVVQTLDRAIHRTEITIQRILLRWIVIYPVDSAIQRLNNLGQRFYLCYTERLEKEQIAE